MAPLTVVSDVVESVSVNPRGAHESVPWTEGAKIFPLTGGLLPSTCRCSKLRAHEKVKPSKIRGDISNDRSGTAQVLAGSRRSQLNMLDVGDPGRRAVPELPGSLPGFQGKRLRKQGT